MSDDDNSDDQNKPKKPRKPARTNMNPPKSDRPYPIGKGKPPAEHQFKKGQPSANPRGRPKGSTRANTLEKLLQKMVVVGHRNGKPIRKALGEVIDHKLVEQAAKGELKAIKLVREIEFRYQKAGFAGLPSADELIRQREEDLRKQRAAETLSATFADLLDFTAELKKLGLIEYVDGQACVPRWAQEAAEAHQAAERKRLSGPPATEK